MELDFRRISRKIVVTVISGVERKSVALQVKQIATTKLVKKKYKRMNAVVVHMENICPVSGGA